jgi:arsenate reductase-like glutaredoxin family protein
MAASPNLIRRPNLVTGPAVVLGFDEAPLQKAVRPNRWRPADWG